MRAIGFSAPGSAEVLIDFETEQPKPGPHDLLVRVHAVSVNPIDTKVRQRPLPEQGTARILGFDAAGVIEACGLNVMNFRPGDEVFYAGVINRPGTNAEYHCVDERIAGPKPKSLGFAEAAALPLTTLTAYEALFDRLAIRTPLTGVPPAVLIVGGAGGVGSMAIQLARKLTDCAVVATASRPETQAWCRELGAHQVIDHRVSIADGYKSLDLPAPPFVFSTTKTDLHLKDIAALIAPQGRMALIDDPETIDIKLLKAKAVSIHWESMFVRPLFATPDMGRQGEILAEVSRLVDDGTLRTTFGEHYGKIDAANLRRAHEMIERGKAKGKIVLEGF